MSTEFDMSIIGTPIPDQKKVEADKEIAIVENPSKFDNTPASAKKRYLGQFLAVLHILAISLAAVVIKCLPYHPFSCGIWRFSGILFPFFIILLLQASYETRNGHKSQKSGEEDHESILHQLRSVNRKVAALLLVRALCSTTAAILAYEALRHISIADVIVITSTEPIFVKLVAYFWLKEPCGVAPVIFASLSVVGIVIVARPPLITGEEEFNAETMIGLSFALGNLACATMIVPIVRYLRTATRLHFAIIITVPGLCGTIICLTLALAVGSALIPETLPHIGLAVLLAIFACMEQITITFALKFEGAGPISIIKTTIVIFSFLWEFLFFGKIPDEYSLIGAGIVIFCVTGTVLHGWLNEKRKDEGICTSA